MLLCLLYSLLLGFVTALQGSSSLQLQLQDSLLSFLLTEEPGPMLPKTQMHYLAFLHCELASGICILWEPLAKSILACKDEADPQPLNISQLTQPLRTCWGPCLFRRAFPSISFVPLATALMIPLCTWPCFLQAGSLSLALAIRFFPEPILLPLPLLRSLHSPSSLSEPHSLAYEPENQGLECSGVTCLPRIHLQGLGWREDIHVLVNLSTVHQKSWVQFATSNTLKIQPES